MATAKHAAEIEKGERFRFRKNWRDFLQTLNVDRIAVAETSLRSMLGRQSFEQLSFVDVRRGSGFFSFVARRLGARVFSCDFVPQSANCARGLRFRYFSDDPNWVVVESSALDEVLINGFGQFDIVYSWCVLHHTGQMWRALDLVTNFLKPNGELFISIYNDQGRISERCSTVKRIYCSEPVGRVLMTIVFVRHFSVPDFILDVAHFRDPTTIYREYYKQHGMSRVHDWYGWLGGYLSKFAKPEVIFDFYRSKGPTMQRMTTCGGGICSNQSVFTSGAGALV